MLVFCYLCEIFRLLYWWKCILISKSAFHCAICHRVEMWCREYQEFSNNFIRRQTWFFTCDWTFLLSFTINRSFKTPELSYFLAWHRHMFGRCRFIMFKKSRNCFCYELDFLVSKRLQYILKCMQLSICVMGWFSRQKNELHIVKLTMNGYSDFIFCHYYSDYSFDFDFKFFIYFTCARLILCNVI